MTQEVFPEIQAAAEALEARIKLTETEIAEMKEAIATRKQQLRSWRKALATVNPQLAAKKKKANAA